MISTIREAKALVPGEMDRLLSEAQAVWDAQEPFEPGISDAFATVLDYMNAKAENSSTAFTNIVTSLAIKAAIPTIDIRYHQEQIQDRTDRGAGFSFRTLSEDDIYPWLQSRQFNGAKSGWQTRTYERDDPYTLSYPHQIGGAGSALKENFLKVYDFVEQKGESAAEALKYLFYLQIRKRHDQVVDLSVPRTDTIDTIVDIFQRHFFYAYAGKGASRLPVLAIYAVYELLMDELGRFDGKTLRPLGAHSAADARTGAVGDIEVEDDDGAIFEALEIKHGIRVDDRVMVAVEDKVSKTAVGRYYVLTTYADCAPDDAARERIARIANVYECVVVIDGVMSTLRYYLRLVSDPSSIFAKYVALLNTEPAIGHEHRVAWNTVVAATQVA